MELTQGMELAQVLKLSPGLLQSMEMLQMNTLELGAYLKELALENPVLEEAEPGQGQGQDTWEAFASQVPWLGDTPWTGQTAQEGDWGRGESPTESLAFLLEEQLARRGLSPELLAVCRYLAGLLDDDGRWTRRTWRGCGQQACRQSFWSGGGGSPVPGACGCGGQESGGVSAAPAAAAAREHIQWPKPSVRAIWRN
ncbi:MAG: hypothetical protein ACLRWL_04670 [Evtepia gabavorous]